ncbi:MAG: NAD(P)H-binding protein [Woeseiaceae bacterium]|nr:NAD(P)H-binding protein [Woeseiaceae bacterium]
MKVAIIGGTGFLGSHIVDAMLEAGHELSLLVRAGSEGKAQSGEGIRTVSGDIDSTSAIRETLEGADAVVYLIGILREHPKHGITFEKTQYQGVVDVADIASELGIRRFLLMSANGVEAEATAYQRTKHEAELYVEKGDFDATIFRPSVVFGDPRGRMEFATQLHQDIVRLPVPAIGFHTGWNPFGGPVLMSPVHVRDVAMAFVAALDDPATIGQTYELGGPETLSWVEMIRRVAAAVDKRKLFIPMPIGLMRIPATLLDWIPAFPVTRDQLTMLEQGNVCPDDALQSLTGRQPKAFSPENLDYLRV